MSDSLSQLPPEISLRVVLELPPSALAAFQQVSPAWKEIVDANADLVFASLAGHDYSAVGAVQGLEHACEAQREKVFERDVWQGVDSWKEFCEFLLSPLTYCGRILTSNTLASSQAADARSLIAEWTTLCATARANLERGP